MPLDHRSDSFPAPSQFRRPWSPYEPLPTITPNPHFNRSRPGEYDPMIDENLFPQLPHRSSKREGSDVSVEALDLADYARTLRVRQAEDPYPTFDPYTSYPPSSIRPLRSYDTLNPPSLVSRDGTLSSNAHTHTSSRTPNHRPFSLPTPSRHTSGASSRPNRSPYIASPAQVQESEVDISAFPAWSRSWYGNGAMRNQSTSPDIYTTIPVSHLPQPFKRSPFDPTYSPYSPTESYGYGPASSLGHDSTRELLPWSNGHPEHDPPLDPSVIEERVQMLQREFGKDDKGKNRAVVDDTGVLLDENGKPIVGTVDRRGNLITQGPKKRIAVRFLQIVLAGAACVPAIYVALIVKPKETPPPAGKPPAFVLYILSVVTLLVLLYLFLLRPCCCAGKRRKGFSGNPLASGMMVLPVQGIPGSKKPKGKGDKKSKKGKGGMPVPGDVHVNLIVDPEAFGRREDLSDEEDDEARGFPGAYRSNGGKKRPRRKGVFEGLAMEEEWKRARAWARKITAVDVAGVILWGAAFVFILIGRRCPSGEFEGWCNGYNTSTAAACLLCVAFSLSLFFDVKDLHASKVSPRTRT